MFHMARRVCTLLALLVCWLCAAPPAPRDHFGYAPGENYKLADYGEITGYFEKLARTSDRIRWVEFGRTSLGKPMFLALISSAENLKRLEHYRQISRRLALGEATAQEARTLAAEGKTIVWIDSGLHSNVRGARVSGHVIGIQMLEKLTKPIFMRLPPVTSMPSLSMRYPLTTSSVPVFHASPSVSRVSQRRTALADSTALMIKSRAICSSRSRR